MSSGAAIGAASEEQTGARRRDTRRRSGRGVQKFFLGQSFHAAGEFLHSEDATSDAETKPVPATDATPSNASIRTEMHAIHPDAPSDLPPVIEVEMFHQ